MQEERAYDPRLYGRWDEFGFAEPVQGMLTWTVRAEWGDVASYEYRRSRLGACLRALYRVVVDRLIYWPYLAQEGATMPPPWWFLIEGEWRLAATDARWWPHGHAWEVAGRP